MARAKKSLKNGSFEFEDETITKFRPMLRKAELEAYTEAQAHYILAIDQSKLIFGLGPAGTGKTYVCSVMALDQLDGKKIKRVIITRPSIETGKSLGFLPGELDEKYQPFIEPFLQVCYERLGQSYAESLLKNDRIKPMPLGYMRGMTFKDCWVIFDEAQNATEAEMKMFLTRIGDNCKVIINGDLDQSDIGQANGLRDATERLDGLSDVSIIHFDQEDIVRSGLVKDILMRYAKK